MRKIIFLAIIGLIVFINLYVFFYQEEKEKKEQEKLPPLEMSVWLYYYSADLDKDESENVLCSRNGLVPLERKIPISQSQLEKNPYLFPIDETIRLLLKGELREVEKSQGIYTEYPLEGFSLKSSSFKDGILTLEFLDLNNRTSGGACRAGVLWFQIEATAKQFLEVQEVRFLPEELFQP